MENKITCIECGLSVKNGSFHPYAACLIFKATGSEMAVHDNINALLRTGADHATLKLRADLKDSQDEVEDLRNGKLGGPVFLREKLVETIQNLEITKTDLKAKTEEVERGDRDYKSLQLDISELLCEEQVAERGRKLLIKRADTAEATAQRFRVALEKITRRGGSCPYHIAEQALSGYETEGK